MGAVEWSAALKILLQITFSATSNSGYEKILQAAALLCRH